MDYLTLRYLHVGAVVVSACGFILRGVLMLLQSPWLQRRWLRIVPHVVDTVLLGSAIGLAVLTAQYPWTQAWLTAKLLGLVAYILCGTMALKRARSRRQRALYFFAALLILAYIVTVARTRSPLGALLWLL